MSLLTVVYAVVVGTTMAYLAGAPMWLVVPGLALSGAALLKSTEPR